MGNTYTEATAFDENKNYIDKIYSTQNIQSLNVLVKV